MKWRVFTLFFLLFTACSYAQESVVNKTGYKVDESLKKTIKKKELIEGQGLLDVQWLENDKPATFPLSSNGQPFYAFYVIENDTTSILIYSMLGLAGIRINIYNDSAWINHSVSSKDRSIRQFKQQKSDTDYQLSPEAPAKNSKLILVKEMKQGEIIEGYVEFESVDFYQKAEKEDKKRNYNAKGYFRAKQLL